MEGFRMIGKKVRVRIACIAAFGLAAALIGPCIDGTYTQAKTETTYMDSTPESGVFRYLKVITPSDKAASRKEASDIAARHVETIANDDTDISKLGSTMTTQMQSFMSNSTAASSYVSDVTGTELASLNEELRQAGYDSGYRDIVTKVTFTLPAGTLPLGVTNMQDALFYLEQAISRYPTLCCFFTMGTLNTVNNTLTVYSPIAKDKLSETINTYRTTLDDMLRVPKTNTSMNDEDKLLYIHDQVVAITEYSVGRSGIYAADYIPAGAMINNLAVCQSYAAVYNQAARELGLTSYVLYSDNHAWVAVRLNGRWYYVDPTWDDTRSVGEGADMVKHNYVFVGSDATSSFSSSHALCTDYASHFSEITGSLGSAYSQYYPKANSITSQMGYANGGFFYADNNGVYQWLRASNKKVTITGIPAASSRRAAVLDGYVYVSGSTGLYRMDPVSNQMSRIDTDSFTGMYEAARKLYVSRGGAFSIYVNQSSPVTSSTPAPTNSANPYQTPLPSGYTPLPSASATPTSSSSSKIPTIPPTPSATIYDPTVVSPTPSAAVPTPTATDYPDNSSFKVPEKTTIKKLKNNATRAAYVKWKKVSNISKYQLQYSTSSDFSSKRTRESLTSSVTIANLTKKKTYYFRVRAVKVKSVNGVVKYKIGAWSTKKKLKIRK